MDHSDPLERATTRPIRRRNWTDDDFRAARDHDLAERTIPVATVVRAVIGCLLLAGLLTSAKLVEIAERMPFGDGRDRALAVADSVDRVANFLSLNRPSDFLADLRAANNAGDGIDPTDPVAVVPTTTVMPGAVVTVEIVSSTTTSTTTVPDGRSVTSAAPLRLYVAGDSQATYLGQAITTESDGRSLVVEVDDRISTSLTRPDYFDWPAQWAGVVAARPPEVVVLFLGANDHQDMMTGGGERLVVGTVAWQEEWRDRLGAGLDVLTAGGAVVVWVTQPPMRDRGLHAGVGDINTLAAEVFAGRDDVLVVDIWDLFGGTAGYQERIEGPDGDVITARLDDGVHLTRAAASWVADLVFARLDERWDFAPTG